MKAERIASHLVPVSSREWARRFFLGCCLLCCAARASDKLAVPTQATQDDILQWLRSGDPRMVAWGATFAAENRSTEMVPWLARLAEGWVPLTYVVEEKWPKKQVAEAPVNVRESSEDCPACGPPVAMVGEPDAADTVLVPGTPTLTEHRALTPGTSFGFGAFTSESRLQLLHAMVVDTSQPLAGFMQDSESVTFTDESAFQAAVQRGVAKREQAFGVLSRALVAKGLMTQAEAQTAWPTLRLYVVDWRETKTPLLSDIKLQKESIKVAMVYSGE